MKVLLSAFACAPNRGSEPGVGWNWAMALSKYNEVTVLTREENRSEIEKYSKNYSIPFNIEYFGIPWFEKHNNFPFQKNIYTMLWQKKVVSFAIRLNEMQHFDICHHVTYASYKYPTRLYKTGLPLIVGPVGGGEKTPASCRKVYSIKNRIIEFIHDAQISRVVKTKAFIKMCSTAKRILLTTNETYECMPQNVRHNCAIMQTIGINEEEIVTQGYPHYTPGECMRIVYVGNLLYLKGVMLFLDITEKLNDINYRIEIIGDGPEKGRMERIIKEKGLEHRFRFLGKVERQDVLRMMDTAHLFLFPSFHDSGAMAVQEAMARRIPVVVLATGGPGVNVTMHRGYCIAPTQDYESIIDGFIKVIRSVYSEYNNNSAEELKKKIDNATTYLLSECTWNKKAEIMQNYYNEIVEKK